MFFNVWSPDHLYQNPLRCLFKMHIPRPEPSPRGSRDPQNLSLSMPPRRSHARYWVSSLVPLPLSKLIDPPSYPLPRRDDWGHDCPAPVALWSQRSGNSHNLLSACNKNHEITQIHSKEGKRSIMTTPHSREPTTQLQRLSTFSNLFHFPPHFKKIFEKNPRHIIIF